MSGLETHCKITPFNTSQLNVSFSSRQAYGGSRVIVVRRTTDVVRVADVPVHELGAHTPCMCTVETEEITSISTIWLYSGELRHGTCHFYTRYTGISNINSVYGNLKDQMKLDLCVCEALSYTYSTMETIFVGMAINYH